MFENPTSLFPMVRIVPYMGVIWTIHEASKLGFYNGHPEWCNVGQGQPEVGEIPKAPPRINSVSLEELIDAAYGRSGELLRFELRSLIGLIGPIVVG